MTVWAPEDQVSTSDKEHAIVVAHLTPEGRERFEAQLGSAADRATVIRAWYRTLLARQHPDYARNMTEDLSGDPVHHR